MKLIRNAHCGAGRYVVATAMDGDKYALGESSHDSEEEALRYAVRLALEQRTALHLRVVKRFMLKSIVVIDSSDGTLCGDVDGLRKLLTSLS